MKGRDITVGKDYAALLRCRPIRCTITGRGPRPGTWWADLHYAADLIAACRILRSRDILSRWMSP